VAGGRDADGRLRKPDGDNDDRGLDADHEEDRHQAGDGRGVYLHLLCLKCNLLESCTENSLFKKVIYSLLYLQCIVLFIENIDQTKPTIMIEHIQYKDISRERV